MAASNAEQTAVVAGGCFWGIQAVFQRLKGVIKIMLPLAHERRTCTWRLP
jgi:peptide methionine sulfoxide reductase MsrA